MSIVPVRNLGARGVLKDVAPWELPPDAWSSGNNVRFDSGKVLRGPAYRLVTGTLTSADPHLLFPVYPSASTEYVIICAKNGRMYKWSSGTETDMTPGGFVNTSSDLPFTACQVGDVVYVNRVTDVPYSLLPPAGAFTALANWTGTWKARSLRSYKSFLVALNVTKGAVENPKLVKWSDIALQGAVPVSWDAADTTKLAGENPLLAADSPLIDGLQLGDDFMVYTTSQVWRMRQTGGRLIMDFRKIFDDAGMINLNCVVEVEGRHYVFGSQDIYIHDGNTKTSIAYGRVKDFIFNSLNTLNKGFFFVSHNPRLREIMFHYSADDGECQWVGTAGCNRVAVYNYRSDTWAFRDAPSVTSAAYFAANGGATWATLAAAGTTWDAMGGSWSAQSDTGNRVLTYSAKADAGFGFATSKLLGLDMIESGSVLAAALDTPSANTAYVERIGIDLDDLMGEQIRGYKVAKSVYPQLKTFGSASTVGIKTGSQIVAQANLVYDTEVSIDPSTQYKADFKKGGRYLAIRYTKSDQKDFELTSHDLDIAVTGRR